MLSWIEHHPVLLETILTVLGIGIATALFCETRRQVDEAHAQVVATYQQTNLMRESTHKELRPYVYISKFIDDSLFARKEYDLSAGKIPRIIRFLVSNSGQTPAYNVHVTGSAHIVDSLPPFDPFGLAVESSAHPVPILPREGVPIYSEFSVIQDSSRVHRTMYLLGKITYEDTFADSHMTTFCYKYILGLKVVKGKRVAERDQFYPEPKQYNREYR